MTEWNMTASQKKIEFFDESKEELENKIANLESKLDEIIKLIKDLKND
jgi:prefoldin subunit 5